MYTLTLCVDEQVHVHVDTGAVSCYVIVHIVGWLRVNVSVLSCIPGGIFNPLKAGIGIAKPSRMTLTTPFTSSAILYMYLSLPGYVQVEDVMHVSHLPSQFVNEFSSGYEMECNREKPAL